MTCQLQHSDTNFYWLNISALTIYERFLSNNFSPKLIRLKQHFWQIYLFGQTKNQYFVPIWALCRHSEDTQVFCHSRHSGTRGTLALKELKELGHSRYPETYSYVPNKRGKGGSFMGREKCSFFGKFGVLCLLKTPVLRFTLLPYYRRIQKIEV